MLTALLVIPTLAKPPEGAPPGQARERVPKVPVTLEGTVEVSTDAEGDASYTLTAGGTTYRLDAGPAWFHGDAHPLAPFVGESVTIEGEQAEGSTEVDVLVVNGTQLREPGKPPWAGGWKVVGERHPGWSQEKADRFAAKFGDCFPPGQCKDKPHRGQGESGSAE
jgi:hypothetical protein